MTDFKSCPACGAGLSKSLPADGDNYARWKFYCDGAIMEFENGTMVVNEQCGNAMKMALLGMVPSGPPVSRSGSSGDV